MLLLPLLLFSDPAQLAIRHISFEYNIVNSTA